MGKKSSLKKIGKLAAELPAMQRPTKIGESITKYEAVKQGLIPEETSEDLFKNYSTLRKISTVQVPVNHKRIMKKMYNAHGKAGVRNYVEALTDVVMRQHANNATHANHP